MSSNFEKLLAFLEITTHPLINYKRKSPKSKILLNTLFDFTFFLGWVHLPIKQN